MKMDRMVEYLENRGFKAEKRYIPSGRRYEFVIIKDGIEARNFFEYPGYIKDGAAIDRIQRDFLEHLIGEYELKKAAVDEYVKYDIKTTREIYDRMNNRDEGIDWSIENIEYEFNADGSRYKVELEARIVGNVNTHYGSFHDHLEAKLNNLDTFAPNPPTITRVIFNDPATIVFWSDGTKTVVTCQEGEERFDMYKGLAMAIVKKTYGNKGNYNEIFKKWCVDEDDENERTYLEEQFKSLSDRINEITKTFEALKGEK